MNIRNIAIIAHVDHGKTTLVDQLIKKSGTLEAHEELAERAMDSNALERERCNTFLAKIFAIHYYVIAKIRQRTTTTVHKRTFPIFILAKRTAISWSVVSSTSIILQIKKDLQPLSGFTVEDWKSERNISRRSS